MDSRSILVTGGAGFIGSAFMRLLVKEYEGNSNLILIDKLTYAGDLERLKEIEGSYLFYKTDICDKKAIDRIFSKHKPYSVFHFAAESHVDRSINDSSPFIETNIKGTQILLDASRKFNVGRFILISTDEIYGEIYNGKVTEDGLIRPGNPYSASKAAADLLTQAYIKTYNFPAIIIRPSNNYGPWQYPEKLVPLSIARIFNGENIKLYGNGVQIREWLYVDDCVQGILKIASKGLLGRRYNLGSGIESTNRDIARLLLNTLQVNPDRWEFIDDRPGHDVRYCLDSSKVTTELKWRPKINLEKGIKLTVNWALENRDWLISKTS
jgi:dTDP-glucose 4,6-dehydratase